MDFQRRRFAARVTRTCYGCPALAWLSWDTWFGTQIILTDIYIMKKNSILPIPIVYQNQLSIVDVFPFDTPLQVAYRFCNEHKLEFNYISPLSKMIIQFVQNSLEGNTLDLVTKSTLNLHFDKFITNPSIRESIKSLENTITIRDNQIVIGENDLYRGEQNHNQSVVQQSNTVDFSFECQEQNQETQQNAHDSYQFSFKNKLNEFLHPMSKPASHHNSKAELYVRKNSFSQIENLQKYESINNKIINRMKNSSPARPNAIPYTEYLRRRDHQTHNASHSRSRIVQHNTSHLTSREQSRVQSPQKNTLQTLPKSRVSVEKLKLRQVSPSEISFQQNRQDRQHQENVQSVRLEKLRLVDKQQRDGGEQKPEQVALGASAVVQGTAVQAVGCIDTAEVVQKLRGVHEAAADDEREDGSDQEQKINEVFVYLDTNKDGYIDQNINLQVLKQHWIDLFEPVWFQIFLKKIKVSKTQFQGMIQKRIRDLDHNDIKRLIFNGIRK